MTSNLELRSFLQLRGLLILFLLLIGPGCTLGHRPEGPFGVPEATDDGWLTSSLEAEGMNTAGIAKVAEFIRQDPHDDFRSLLISRNGRLVFEAYFNGHGRDSLHDIRSATKSLTSALVGIAIAKGLVDGTHVNVISSFPSYAPYANDDTRKQTITVEHLLTMASGLDANGSDPATPGYEDRMWETQNWVRFAVDLPMVDAPGERWTYASVNTFLLGAFVEQAAGQPLAMFARESLFGPLGVTSFRWAETPTGRTVAQGNLSVRARDMAKFGQLYLDGGRWTGEQIVPESWVHASIMALYPVPWDGYDSYGYSWYTHALTVAGREFRYFFASGNGGNKIYVLPEERMVVAIQSAAYNTSYGQRRSLEVLRQVLAALAE